MPVCWNDFGTISRSTGKERDTETGLDFFGARYFSGAQGRFTSSDPLAGWADDPQSWNKYAYSRNNPLLYTDPTGMRYTICDANRHCSDDYSDADFDKNLSGTSKNGTIFDNVGNKIGTYERTSFDDLSPMGNMFFNQMSARRATSNGAIAAFGVASLAGGGIVAGGMAIAGGTGLTTLTIPAGTLAPLASNPTLQKIVNKLFQVTDQLPGGTAGAVRYERLTGDLLSPAGHFQKAAEMIEALTDLLRSGKLSANDQLVTRQVIGELSSALQTQPRK